MDFSKPTECKCFAALQPNGPIVPHTITRRACHDNDVVIDIQYAGICHSDIHQVREEWDKGIFPMVPGHEIVGHVVAVGKNVQKFKVGDIAGVGCMVDSCRACTQCKLSEEQFCANGCTFTYNGMHTYDHSVEKGQPTYGGYSKHIVVDQAFVLSIPSNLDLAAAAPLLCAGITTYSPLMKFGLKPGMRFGVAGLGGLGHMGVKFGKAMGCHTTVISRGTGKRSAALDKLKADAYLDIKDDDAVKEAKGKFDFILNTISADYDVNQYIDLLSFEGKMIFVGVPPNKQPLHLGGLIFQRKMIGGSLIGGIKETQEMLDFCGKHNIVCDIELVTAEKIDEMYDRVVKADVQYRAVIDMTKV